MTQTERAIDELKRAGLYDEDSDYGGMIGKAVEELLLIHQKQRHSGFSSSLVASIFHRLIDGEVLNPLTDEAYEWEECPTEPFDKPMFQNRRMPSVFADGPNGENAYFIEGRVFVSKDGDSFTHSKESTVPVKLPIIPKTEYIYENRCPAKYGYVFVRSETGGE